VAPAKTDFIDRLIVFSESILTRRKRRSLRRKEKQKRRHPVVDWLDAFLWAAMVVLLINQYLIQAYQIPSGSMMNTLLIRDRIFVNKLVYGPEILPGIGKVPGFRESRRTEVIIFENPDYASRGPVFDVLQRVIYMLTLSLVDIDRDPQTGLPKAHFLIKRQVAQDGDRAVFREGNLWILPRGESELLREADFKSLSGLEYGNRRLLKTEEYPLIQSYGVATALRLADLSIPSEMMKDVEAVNDIRYPDIYEWEYWRDRTLWTIFPQDKQARGGFARKERGRYVPMGWVLPLGDNRDNSRDGRFFGPIPREKVLGRALFIYWPLNRIRGIR
jgi:signal peptidase I